MKILTAIPIPLSGAPHRFLLQCQRALQAAEADVNWVAHDQFHIRLSSVQSVPQDLWTPMEIAVRDVAARMHPFSVALRWLNAAPNREKPRTLYSSAVDEAFGSDSDPLDLLTKRLGEAMVGDGIRTDVRPRHQIVTLGRVVSKRNTRALAKLLEDSVPGGAHFVVDHITINEVAGAAEPRFIPLYDAPLNGKVKEWEAIQGVWSPPPA